ncbi:MAG: 16S rRNA (adenine(1518)-N(6)/adenine(1519)-N(6))-dimethyltransferase RsmA [Acidimicrobiaceae bacterium]|nr:16S rRNA (adenine(1518)-N(6)/adenine(1519)-N(6))-dimethyltransferase RsmA [Acidimicrobiaceae bacterium]MCY4280604.1 16S rRNA (adenine(1518)-N(6)/adenine(1519)-N(6))-dimethyltransferase RsmA [Acidimicrobiaceae bacterium]MCY4294700.1 16S rRNA (adenine(1518)-N(6)/adenine(1519)-N(6))-dimethyltransferase RsmA [Acidimicrobiaceae bacterium]
MADLQEAAARLIHTEPQLKALLERFGLTPRRSHGQNFVVDPNTIRRLVRLSGAGPGDHVLEIGAGLGSLTFALAAAGARVLAVEVDAGLAAALRELLDESRIAGPDDSACAGGRVTVLEADAAQLDFDPLLAGCESWMLVANLPYNIATPLVLGLLRSAHRIRTMSVLLQREPAERLTAPPGSRSRGIPSVLLERRAAARIVGKVPPSVFWPRPKVDSALLRVERLDSRDLPRLSAEAETRFEKLVRAGFGQRRKMLRRSLAGLIDDAGFAAAGVDPAARPETLTLSQWLAMADRGVPATEVRPGPE